MGRAIVRFNNSTGKVAERWVIEDEMEVLRQMDQIPRFRGQDG